MDCNISLKQQIAKNGPAVYPMAIVNKNVIPVNWIDATQMFPP
jgi:hypothetical protein